MKYRVLTVNREFGSGGGRIAQKIAECLGWKLLDRDIIDAIAYAAHVEPKVVQRYDEHVQSWLRRLNQQAMRRHTAQPRQARQNVRVPQQRGE